MIILILIAAMVVLIAGYHLSSVRIKFETNPTDIEAIRIYVAGTEIYLTNEAAILQAVEEIRKIKYFKYRDLTIDSKDPDAYIAFFDENGDKLESLVFYGVVAIHNQNYKEKYWVMPFTYNRLEDLCNKINEIK